ncbi:MAG TPA: polyhydroxyalkanoate synthesis regulator DNA-binding domain-containing protein [Anaerolineales bacterium]|nr:polyhydroxyalkanoate synthesis regulator DNA-binding domain-containing protein [Anaerolineales bacterium]
MDETTLTIKRYPNRKFYNPDARQYITLEGIAGLIRQGREVQVIDHASGEDLTTLVLTQIILEQEKRQSGFMPISVLTGLVQASGFTLSRMRQALASPVDWLRQIDEEIEHRIELLKQNGELTEGQAADLQEKLLNQGRVSSGEMDEASVRRFLDEQGVPTRQDLQKIDRQLEILLEQISKIQPEPEDES